MSKPYAVIATAIARKAREKLTGRAQIRAKERTRMMTLIREKPPVSVEDAAKLIEWYIAADPHDRYWLTGRVTFRTWYWANRETVNAVGVLLDATNKIRGRIFE